MAGRTRWRTFKASNDSKELLETKDNVVPVKSAKPSQQVNSVRHQRALLPREDDDDDEFMFTNAKNDDMTDHMDFHSLPPQTSIHNEKDRDISNATLTRGPGTKGRKASKRRRLDESNDEEQLSPTGDWPLYDKQTGWAPEAFDNSGVSVSNDRSHYTPRQSKSSEKMTNQYVSPPESIELSPTSSNSRGDSCIINGKVLAAATHHFWPAGQPLRFTDDHKADARNPALGDDENADKKLERLHVYRERNRVAAKKCRSRKKAVVQKLEDTHDIEKATNDALKRQIMELRNELVGIRMEALSHTSTNVSCRCKRIHQYNHNKAMELSYGGGAGVGGARDIWT